MGLGQAWRQEAGEGGGLPEGAQRSAHPPSLQPSLFPKPSPTGSPTLKLVPEVLLPEGASFSECTHAGPRQTTPMLWDQGTWGKEAGVWTEVSRSFPLVVVVAVVWEKKALCWDQVFKFVKFFHIRKLTVSSQQLGEV